ncbi:MAG TPA: SpoIID/LytB domain-containing protein [Pyrinomonadaceae bacterium]|jgi:stage II sporulation protein D
MMRSSKRLRLVALLVAHTLIFSSLAFTQDATRTQTRPRRVNPPAQTETPPTTTATQTATDALESPTNETTETAEAPLTTHVAASSVAAHGEPSIRVGLATDARAVTVSTNGLLLHAPDVQSNFVTLDVARVRIEPRRYAPPPFATPSENAPDLAAQSDSSKANARDVQLSQRKDAAIRSDATNTRESQPTRTNKLRLAASVSAPVMRGAAVYAPGNLVPLMDVRAPIVFASADESQYPLKFNEKVYRGRLEIFANERGTLTVVNIVGLEDYVRGVVPNELSPGGYPALEALKAQAVAARTYALSNRGRFVAAGFDVLPSTRSQVYGGRQTEHALTDRAVAETRGRIATYKGEVINALYTSTCGGRTEHAENVFGGEAVPYLRARECAAEGHEAFAPYVVKSSREPLNLREQENLASAREAALLLINGFRLAASRIDDEWLAAPVTVDEVRALVVSVASLARQPVPVITNEGIRPPAFATALAQATDGESRGDVLLGKADVDYLLSFSDAGEIPTRHRADVAIFLRDAHLALHADATLRPSKAMSRARAMHAVAHLLEARGLLRLQKATARPTEGGALVLRPPNGKGAERSLVVSQEAYLFRAFGEQLHQMREVTIVGGEPVVYHTNARGEVDYLEVRPAPNGAAADRFAHFANWTVALSPAQVAARLSRQTGRIGSVVNLRVVARGASRRVLDLEVTGTNGTAHIRGGKIRTALGLREQLFVVERRYDEQGNPTSFVLTGRGWGHGVGMCQVGAYGLARAGWSYEKILKAYYTGITLTKAY